MAAPQNPTNICGDISFLAAPANLPMWRGFMARSWRFRQFAALSLALLLLRLAPLEVFAERAFQPILP
jgi:hypothetical protein